MPSKSPAQAHLMAAVAHGWKKPGGGGPPVSVAKEFNQADKGTGIMSKGNGPMEASYAQGGLVLGRTKDFMKEPDKFREGRFQPKPEKTDETWGKGQSAANPAAKDKSLTPVKPRGC